MSSAAKQAIQIDIAHNQTVLCSLYFRIRIYSLGRINVVERIWTNQNFELGGPYTMRNQKGKQISLRKIKPESHNSVRDVGLQLNKR